MLCTVIVLISATFCCCCEHFVSFSNKSVNICLVSIYHLHNVQVNYVSRAMECDWQREQSWWVSFESACKYYWSGLMIEFVSRSRVITCLYSRYLDWFWHTCMSLPVTVSLSAALKTCFTFSHIIINDFVKQVFFD